MEKRGPTQDEFDGILLSLADIMGTDYLITSVPGVYEAVSEHFNNDILESWEDAQEALRGGNNG